VKVLRAFESTLEGLRINLMDVGRDFQLLISKETFEASSEFSIKSFIETKKNQGIFKLFENCQGFLKIVRKFLFRRILKLKRCEFELLAGIFMVILAEKPG
jgi:hypothetical protein